MKHRLLIAISLLLFGVSAEAQVDTVGTPRLPTGCSDTQVASWNNTTRRWVCSSTTGLGLPGLDTSAILKDDGDVSNTLTFTLDDYTSSHEITWPDFSGTPAFIDRSQTFTGTNIFNADLSVWEGSFDVADPVSLGSESLTNGVLTAGTSWAAAGDFALTGNEAVYTHSAGSGSLTQASGSFAIPIRANRWYEFSYTTSVVTADATVEISGFSLAPVSLPITAGAHVVDFKTSAVPGDLVIAVVSTSGSVTFDALTLQEVMGGDVTVAGRTTTEDLTATTAVFTGLPDNGNSGTSKTIDWTAGNKQSITTTGNCTLTFTAPSGPTNLQLKIIHEASATAYTYVWPAAVKWESGVAISTTNTSGSVDIVSLFYDGTNYYAMGGVNFQ